MSLLPHQASALTDLSVLLRAEFRKLFSHKPISLVCTRLRMILDLNAGPQIARICVQCSTNCSGPLEPYVERQFCRCTNNSNWRTFLMKTLPVNARRIRWSGLLLLVT